MTDAGQTVTMVVLGLLLALAAMGLILREAARPSLIVSIPSSPSRPPFGVSRT